MAKIITDSDNNNNMEYNVDYSSQLSKARQEFNALLNSHLGRYFTRYVLSIDYFIAPVKWGSQKNNLTLVMLNKLR